jgi:hypothetical protein
MGSVTPTPARARSSARLVWVGLLLTVVLVTSGSACAPGTERHPLPRLAGLGSVELPGGFAGYERPTAPYASRHPTHVDTVFFELDPSTDLGGNHRCRAQITVSGLDPQIDNPAAHIELLGTKLCDASWFGTQSNGTWVEQGTGRWTLRFSYGRSGWFSYYSVPAVAVVRFLPERGLTIGLWADEDVYSLDGAAAVVDEVARSVA